MATPMMQQYWDAKEKHPGMLLFFRMGDFYELFGEDAEVASRLLGLTLTSRDKSMPMAGFPHHQLENYLRKMIASGRRVAVCDQVEDPAQAKGIVKREVTRVVTPGTITEDDLLDPQRSNHLVAVAPGPGETSGLAWLELSTGAFFAVDVPTARLADELARLAPAELVSSERDRSEAEKIASRLSVVPAFAAQPDWTFDRRTATQTLREHFQVGSLAGFGFDDDQLCLAPAGALLRYAREMLKNELPHVRRLQACPADAILQLDETTRRSLELTRTIRDGGRDGSLLAAVDRTVTTMGARLLQEWLLAPLAQRGPIEARYDAVAELLAGAALRDDVRESLRQTHDLQRLCARVSTNRASPRDLAAIARTLGRLPHLKAKLSARRSALLADVEGRVGLAPELRSLLESALVDEPPHSAKDGGLVRPGYDATLDDLREISRGGKEWIARFQAQEIERSGIPSLKVGFNKVFGYYIEITHAHAQKIPSDYQRKQTLKNAERYVTPELKEYEEKVLSAEDKIQAREFEIFSILREQAALEAPNLLRTAEALAQLDVLAGLAELASSRQYARPTLADEPVLHIVQGRHPVLEQTLPPGTFVPNDVSLGGDQGTLWLITGPNMAGKSTFIRQVATLTLLAQVGSFVPAQSATIGVADRIFTRVGASDELSRGQSTFMVEMTEAANILNNATRRSLVILDEIGRGTSTYDGVSLAWAIAEHLHWQLGCRALFATHYHELARLSHLLPNLRNCNVLVREQQDGIVFLHQIAPGAADKSYGIHVARLAGIPDDVVRRARQVLAQLESHPLDSDLSPPRRRRRAPTEAIEVQPSLFGD